MKFMGNIILCHQPSSTQGSSSVIRACALGVGGPECYHCSYIKNSQKQSEVYLSVSMTKNIEYHKW